MKRKYLSFGLGIGLCVVLSAFLLYGVYAGFAEENQKESPDKAQVQKSFGFAIRGKAQFVNTSGENIGMAQLEENANGVLIRLEGHDLPAGYHAIHIHESGDCTPIGNFDAREEQDYFENAGSHLNPNQQEHGLLNSDGPHAGDLMNIHVNSDGVAKVQLFNDRVTLQESNDQGLGSLLDADGSAFIIHSGTDDYKISPTGNAGDRIACAVIERE